MNNYFERKKLDTYNYNNNNYNKPLYTKDENPNSLYDPYEGFIRGNLFKNLYNGYKLKDPIDIEPLNEQADLLTYIDAFSFAAHDISLYLDIYPKDPDMIQLFNKYKNETNRLVKEYEKKFGPLFANSTADMRVPWEWSKSPWPWEK